MNKLEPFLSDEEYEDFTANRLAEISAYAATQYRSNINVEKITFVKRQENKEKETIGYDYTMTFKLTGKVNKTVTKKGKMVLIKTENG
ncbi:hypothetical protein [Microaerobacter geothermalis]|uniref:hypothetical protein n=1 Tax=Microaerobacter geothermalis TaxID=674972 RepID=UPI001F2A94A1|nr:hypothetical protein [Microaerobacter geothermalis]